MVFVFLSDSDSVFVKHNQNTNKYKLFGLVSNSDSVFVKDNQNINKYKVFGFVSDSDSVFVKQNTKISTNTRGSKGSSSNQAVSASNSSSHQTK